MKLRGKAATSSASKKQRQFAAEWLAVKLLSPECDLAEDAIQLTTLCMLKLPQCFRDVNSTP